MLLYSELTPSPTAEPTVLPTASPTTLPTESPVSCDMLWIDIQNFDELTSSDIQQNVTLRLMMTNVTYLAMVERADVLGIGREQFYMKFQNVSEPLTMVYCLCAFMSSTLESLLSMISSAADEVTESMELSLIERYDLGRDHEVHIVIDSDPIEFSICICHLKGCHVDLIMMLTQNLKTFS